MIDIKKVKIGDSVYLVTRSNLECTVTGFYQGLDKLVEIESIDKSITTTVYPNKLHGVDNNINIKYSNGEY